jgi:hypothetical protein
LLCSLSHSTVAAQESAGATAAAPTSKADQIAREVKTADSEGTVFFSAQQLAEQCDLTDKGKRRVDDEVASIGGIHCMGFIAGVSDMLSVLKFRAMNPYQVCAPDGITVGQLEKVFKKYADDHPEQLHLSAADVVSNAFAKAFPCSQ